VNPQRKLQNLNCLKIHPANLIRHAYSRNKLWLRQYIGADVLFSPILLAWEKEKPFKKFATLFLFVKTSLINKAVASTNGNRFFTQK
jgi:hypothetical protein